VKLLLIHQAFLPSHDQAPYEPRPAAHVRHPITPICTAASSPGIDPAAAPNGGYFAGLALIVNHVV
jgi:hypothetical protein